MNRKWRTGKHYHIYLSSLLILCHVLMFALLLKPGVTHSGTPPSPLATFDVGSCLSFFSRVDCSTPSSRRLASNCMLGAFHAVLLATLLGRRNLQGTRVVYRHTKIVDTDYPTHHQPLTEAIKLPLNYYWCYQYERFAGPPPPPPHLISLGLSCLYRVKSSNMLFNNFIHCPWRPKFILSFPWYPHEISIRHGFRPCQPSCSLYQHIEEN